MAGRFREYVSTRKILLFTIEGGILYGCFFLANLLSREHVTRALGGILEHWPPTSDAVNLVTAPLLVALVFALVFSYFDFYDWRTMTHRGGFPSLLAKGMFWGVVFTKGVHLALPLVLVLRFWMGVLPGAIVATAAILAWRLVYYALFVDWQARQRLLILGTGSFARTLEEEIERRKDMAMEVVGFLRPPGGEPPPSPGNRPEWTSAVRQVDARRVLGTTDHLRDIVRRHKIHRVAVAIQERRGHLPFQDLLSCKLDGVPVEEGEAVFERLTGKIAVERLRPSYLIFSEGFEKTKATRFLKRSMDLVLAALSLAITFPVFVIAAIVIRLDSPGPVFLRQQRVGRGGRVFTLLKFRSMRADAEAETGPVWAKEHDDRVTRAGRLLRKLRIDEIPQAINVLQGAMSFVGPRPERPFFVEELKREIPFYEERLAVKPGITGWAQINYPYGSSKRDALEKLQFDLYYIKNVSILLDLYILLSTVKVILLRKGAR